MVAAAGRTTILASHDPVGALPLADQVVFLERARVLFAGTPEEYARCGEEAVRRYREASAC